MTNLLYISQLGSAAPASSTDILPVTQGSTGPGTGTTVKMTIAQLAAAVTTVGTSIDPAINTSGLTTQGTAYLLNKNSSFITTGSAGSGTRLPTWNLSAIYQVSNRTGILQSCWPDVGSQIEAVGTNNPLPLPTGSDVTFIGVSTGLWRAVT